MALFDVIILLALGFSILNGVKEGLIGRAVGIAAFVAALITVRSYYDNLQEIIIGLPEKNFLVAIIAVIVLTAIFGYVFKLAEKSLDLAKIIPGVAAINKIGGAVIGFIEGVVALAILVYASYWIWSQDVVEEWVADLMLGGIVQATTNFIAPIMSHLLDIV